MIMTVAFYEASYNLYKRLCMQYYYGIEYEFESNTLSFFKMAAKYF